MTKHIIKGGIGDGSHFAVIGLFNTDELRDKIVNFLNAIRNTTQKPFINCTWSYSLDREIYARDIMPRREWRIKGDCRIHTTADDRNYKVSIGSYRDGFHIKFFQATGRHIADFEFKKAVFGDINASSAFSKNSKNVPKLIMNVFQDIYDYWESKI